jgi:catechol 2,3-dioxygenase-like lactoylglutathione lyase family enzyme
VLAADFDLGRVGHIGIHVSDVDRSIDFYRRVLGLKPNFEGWTFDGVGKGPQMLGFCARVRSCGAK